MPLITAIGTATPQHKHKQLSILNFMKEILPLEEPQARLLSLLYHRCGIDTRYSVLPDYSLSPTEFQFYARPDEDKPFPSLEARMAVYEANALALSLEAIKATVPDERLKEITHLITVTCTGLSAPGLDLQIMEALDLPSSTFRTSVNFMGCYAAIHALKLANALAISSANAKVLVVCTEMCTLHFQKSVEIDQLTSSLLFADGSAACLVESNEDQPGLLLSSFFSKVVSEGKQDMAWGISSTGFKMVLSNHVPKLVESEIDKLLGEALHKLNWQADDISHWAIHPGGKDILTATQKALQISAAQLAASYDVLTNFGNMSSPTVLFVLKQLFDKARDGERIFAAAFGPGITLESAQLVAQN